MKKGARAERGRLLNCAIPQGCHKITEGNLQILTGQCEKSRAERGRLLNCAIPQGCHKITEGNLQILTGQCEKSRAERGRLLNCAIPQGCHKITEGNLQILTGQCEKSRAKRGRLLNCAIPYGCHKITEGNLLTKKLKKGARAKRGRLLNCAIPYGCHKITECNLQIQMQLCKKSRAKRGRLLEVRNFIGKPNDPFNLSGLNSLFSFSLMKKKQKIKARVNRPPKWPFSLRRKNSFRSGKACLLPELEQFAPFTLQVPFVCPVDLPQADRGIDGGNFNLHSFQKTSSLNMTKQAALERRFSPRQFAFLCFVLIQRIESEQSFFFFLDEKETKNQG